MRQERAASFEQNDPEELEKADVLDNLNKLSWEQHCRSKSGAETWACAWAPDNSVFAWSSGHRRLHLIPWDCSKRRIRDLGYGQDRKYHLIDCGANIWSLAFGSGNVHVGAVFSQNRFSEQLIIATGLSNGCIKIWNCLTGTLIVELLDHKDTVRCLDISRDGQLQLISGSKDGTLKLWDCNDEGNMYRTYKTHSKIISGCKFSPNGQFIAAAGSGKGVYLIVGGSKKNSQIHRLEGHCNDVVSVDFSPDSALLVTSSYDTKVIIWDCYTHRKLRVLGHLHPSPRLVYAGGANDHYVRDVSFSCNGQIIASVCDDGYVRFWDLQHHGDPVSIADVSECLSCEFSSDGSTLAVGCSSGNVEFLASPLAVPSLLHLARVAVRSVTTTAQVDKVPVPTMLKHFLKYRDFCQEDSSGDEFTYSVRQN